MRHYRYGYIEFRETISSRNIYGCTRCVSEETLSLLPGSPRCMLYSKSPVLHYKNGTIEIDKQNNQYRIHDSKLIPNILR